LAVLEERITLIRAEEMAKNISKSILKTLLVDKWSALTSGIFISTGADKES